MYNFIIILNSKSDTQTKVQVRIGNEIVTQEESAKLLGITFNANQKWKNQIHGKGGVLSSLNEGRP